MNVFNFDISSLIFEENLGGSFAKMSAQCWGRKRDSKMERAAADATSTAKSSLAESKTYTFAKIKFLAVGLFWPYFFHEAATDAYLS